MTYPALQRWAVGQGFVGDFFIGGPPVGQGAPTVTPACFVVQGVLVFMGAAGTTRQQASAVSAAVFPAIRTADSVVPGTRTVESFTTTAPNTAEETSQTATALATGGTGKTATAATMRPVASAADEGIEPQAGANPNGPTSRTAAVVAPVGVRTGARGSAEQGTLATGAERLGGGASTVAAPKVTTLAATAFEVATEGAGTVVECAGG